MKTFFGFDDWVLAEADRCLGCFEPPCQKACPASIPIPGFIRAINSGNLQYAAQLVRQSNPMVATCGVVCPEEVFCQTQCTRGKIDQPIKIRELHGYATKFEKPIGKSKTNGQGRVAIVGSGPAGISCAVELARAGIPSIIYEQSDHPGGVPNSSIPEFRIAKTTVDEDIEYARNLGIKILQGSTVENPAGLLKQFDAVFVATGLAKNKILNIPGESLPGVITALPFLEKARAGIAEALTDKRVAVIGGGNVSLDVAATASALGAAEVHLVYRRSPKEIKVWQSELAEAQHRGVMIDYLSAPVEFVADGRALYGVKCIRMRLTDEVDSSGRKVPKEIGGTEFVLPADLAIIAVGLGSSYLPEVKANPDLSTSMKGVFAGGDWARGEGTIVEAARDGKLAAQAIINYLKDKLK
jgi:glutamate synthase (NADPH/NADH) small chain